jgi:outer membrane lipoprotein-sorting protein
MRGTNRLRVLRWAVPAAAVAAVAVAASGVLTADADPPLPPKTAAALLVDLQHPDLAGFSGTVVQKSDLGLPVPPTGGAVGQESLATLLTGSHTVRVWSAGQTKQRVAVLDTLGESDLVRNGPDLWLWTSGSHTATHYRLPADAGPAGTDPHPGPTGLTPQEAADAALKAIDPTTAVTTDGTRSVAGRAAYELVLSPRDTRSLIGQVRLAVDARTHLPLRVQVYARSGGGPAFEVGFTRISYVRPGDEQFGFVPPRGVTVKEGDASKLTGAAGTHQRPSAGPSGARPRMVGTGWTAVVEVAGVRPPAGRSNQRTLDGQLTAILGRLPRVSGSWGSGQLLTSKLVSALLTDDGRLLVGAVRPELLYAAAGHR